MKILTKIIIKIIKFYQYLISPLLGNNCRYLPTCSEYFIESLREYGLIRGFFMKKPLIKPYSLKDSIKYSEQVGKYLQLLPSKGEIKY